MHVELTDLFRCPVPHRDSWLVAAADRTEARVILDGVLGCPECGAEYPIRGGVARFDARTSQHGDYAANSDPEFAFRIAALLGATDGSVTIALVGTTTGLARAIGSVVPVRCIVVDAADEDFAVSALRIDGAPLAIIRGNGTLPVARGVLGGVYAGSGDPAVYTAALRAGGRLVAPVACTVPAGITELARDGSHWVGERAGDTSTAPASLVELRRRR